MGQSYGVDNRPARLLSAPQILAKRDGFQLLGERDRLGRRGRRLADRIFTALYNTISIDALRRRKNGGRRFGPPRLEFTTQGDGGEQ